MDYNTLTDDDKAWLTRINDIINTVMAQKRPKFTRFCNPRLLLMFERFIKVPATVNFALWGGYQASERKIIGFFPEFAEPDLTLFPMCVLNITNAPDKSHRDFLGSILNLGIDRDTIGDIIITPDGANVLISDTVAEFVYLNLEKVANRRVHSCTGSLLELSIPERSFDEIKGSVSSLRLDCIVGLLARVSRSGAIALVEKEHVFVNHHAEQSPSFKVIVGDVIAIRGYGKACLAEVHGETKKGRIRITLNKYI